MFGDRYFIQDQNAITVNPRYNLGRAGVNNVTQTPQ
jgi:hypothetical protein